MIIPKINKVYADNGELSHYEVVNKHTGELLWEQPEESADSPQLTTVGNESRNKELARHI